MVHAEAAAFQTSTQVLALEIDRHKDRLRRDLDSSRLQEFAFPLLGGRMIDLKHTQSRMRIAVSKGVESRA